MRSIFLALCPLALYPTLALSAVLYAGAGGCDGSDAACVSPPTPSQNLLQVLDLSAEGGLHQVGSLPMTGPAVWLTKDSTRKCLYAALAGPNLIASFSISDPKAPKLVSEVNSTGVNPVHMSVVNGNILVAANYKGPDDGTDDSGAGVSSFIVGEDCSLTAADSVPHHGHSVDPTRQNCAHVHSITAIAPGLAVACDLGQDLIFTYSVGASGKFTELSRIATSPGSGPRHTVPNPTKSILYVVFEMGNLVEVYKILKDGELSLAQTVSTLPKDYKGFSKAAEIVISPDGNTLYVSNRGPSADSNSLALYTVAADGSLDLPPRFVHAEGSYPRGMDISDDGKQFLVAGQDSGSMASFEVHPRTGDLTWTGTNITGLPTPVTVVFA